jgi:putative phage-type endonuclease
MNLKEIENEVDIHLWNTVNNDYIVDNDINEMINYLTSTISIYYEKINDKELFKKIIEFIVNNKFKRVYTYDLKQLDFSSINNEINNDQYVYPHKKYKHEKYIRRNDRVEFIKKLPQYPQKSAQWHEQRKKCVTATAIASVLLEDKYKTPYDILLDKCGKGEPFKDNKNVHHGKKYEDIITLSYSLRRNVQVEGGERYGLLPHDNIKFIGASPDGICNKETYCGTKLSKLVGRLVEIKCPFLRKIITEGNIDGDICPHYYWIQVQTQLEVTDLDECDFVQCKLYEYASFKEFENDTCHENQFLSNKTKLEKGCVIQLLPKKFIPEHDEDSIIYKAKYIYPPKINMSISEIKQWIFDSLNDFNENELSQDYYYDKVIYWRFDQLTITLIKRDKDWFNSKLPIIEQFWEYILFYRSNIKKLDELISYVNKLNLNDIHKPDNMNLIFSYVHNQFIELNPKTKFKKSLYKTNNYYELYPSYQKFIPYGLQHKQQYKSNLSSKPETNKSNNLISQIVRIDEEITSNESSRTNVGNGSNGGKCLIKF